MWLCSNPFWEYPERLEVNTCLENTVLLGVPTFYTICGFVLILLTAGGKCSPHGHSSDKFQSNLLKVVKAFFYLAAAANYAAIAVLSSKRYMPQEITAVCVKSINCLLATLLLLVNDHRTGQMQSIFWLLQLSCDMPRFYRHLMQVWHGPETMNLITILKGTVCPLVLTAFLVSTLRVSASRSKFRFNWNIRWFASFVWKSYKRFSISPDDLPVLPETLSPRRWNFFGGSQSLFDQLRNSCLEAILEGAIMTVAYVVLRITSCLEFNAMILYMESEQSHDGGAMYVLAIFSMSAVSSVVQRYAEHTFAKCSIRLKGELLTALNDQALRIGSGKLTSKQGDFLSLCTTDVDNVCAFVSSFGIVISAPVQIAYCTLVLYEFLGWSSVVGVGILVLFVLFITIITSCHRRNQKRRLSFVSQRNSCVENLLQNLTTIKTQGWEALFAEIWTSLLGKEERFVRRVIFWFALLKLLWSVTPFIMIASAFTVYSIAADIIVIRASTAFVCMSLLNGLRFSLASIPDFIYCTISAKSSLNKLSKFLETKPINKQINRSDLHELTIRIAPPIKKLSQLTDASMALSLEAATLSKYDDLQPNSFLQNITLEIKPGTLNVILGLPGAGKSMLLSGLAGDLYLLDGRRTGFGNVGFIPQIPWIFTGSVRENIILGRSFYAAEYLKTLKICGLDRWINSLPDGDDTLLNGDAVRVNDDFKKLVQLARVIYQECDIYVMDAPLCGVNRLTSDKLAHELLSNEGILGKKTRIIVTNNLKLLKEADQAFLISQGKLVEQATFEEIVRRCEIDSKFDIDELMTFNATDSVNTNERRGSEMPTRDRIKSVVAMLTPISTEEIDVASEVDDQKLPKLTVRMIVDFFFAQNMFFTTLVIICLSLASRGCDILAGFHMTMWSQDKVEWGVSHRNLRLLCYLLLGLVHAVLLGITFLWVTLKVKQIVRELYNKWFLKLLSERIHIIASSTKLHSIVTQFTNDREILEMSFSTVVLLLIEVTFQIFLISMFTSFVMPLSTPMSIFIFILYFSVQIVYVWGLKRVKKLDAQYKSNIANIVNDLINGSAVIRGIDMEQFWRQRFQAARDSLQRIHFTASLGRLWLLLVLDILGNLLLLNINIFNVFYRSSITPGLAGLMSSYTMGALGFFHSVVQYATEVGTCIAMFKRIANTAEHLQPHLQSCSSFSEATSALQMKNDEPSLKHVSTDDWPKHGFILFENYSARKPGSRIDTVLRNINLAISPGEKVAIVGACDNPRSYLLLSLFKGVLRTAGSLVIDGRDIDIFNCVYSQDKIGYLPAVPLIFQGTLRFNLDPNQRHTNIEIWQILNKIKYDTILPNGLETNVAELHLSLGQQQLICLGRLMLCSPVILAIECVNESLDLETTRLIHGLIRNEFQSTTVLHVVPHLNVVFDYDHVVIMADGDVKEDGKPAELLQRHNSYLYRMAKEAGLIRTERLI